MMPPKNPADWFEISDEDAESPGHPWSCDCPICSTIHEAEAAAVARPEELAA